MKTLSTGLQNVPSTGPGGVWASRTTLCPLKKNQQKTAVRHLQYRIHRKSVPSFVRALTGFWIAGAENGPFSGCWCQVGYRLRNRYPHAVCLDVGHVQPSQHRIDVALHGHETAFISLKENHT